MSSFNSASAANWVDDDLNDPGSEGGGSPHPIEAWSHLTDFPLQGMAFAPEPERLLVWDESGLVILLNAHGQRLAQVRAPEPIAAASISGDGSRIAVVMRGARFQLLDEGLGLVKDRACVFDPVAVALDAHGRYTAISSRSCRIAFYSRYGVAAGTYDGHQPPTQLTFIPGRAALVAATSAGTLLELDLNEPQAGRLAASVRWQTFSTARVGRIAVDGDGDLILASCHNLGVQRYDGRGRNDGAYQVGGTVTHAVCDMPGRCLAAATHEGELIVLSRAGSIRTRLRLDGSIQALEMDGLGRYVIYGTPQGELTRLNLDGRAPISRALSPRVAGRAETSALATSAPVGSGPVRSRSASRLNAATEPRMRRPAWRVPVATDDLQAETAVLAVLDQPPRIGLMSRSNRLELFDFTGKRRGRTPELHGSGRLLQACPHWMAAATDRSLALVDLKRGTVHPLDLDLVQLSHLAIQPDSYGVAVVMECDRIGRATTAGRWVWRTELHHRVEDLAIAADGLTAWTGDDGLLRVTGPGGNRVGEFRDDQGEPLALVAAPGMHQLGATTASSVAWITLARRGQVARGHAADGSVVWQTPLPWESWGLHVAGHHLIVVGLDGRLIALDLKGRPLTQSAGHRHRVLRFVEVAGGEIRRITLSDQHLFCSTLTGETIWRALVESATGALAVGRDGVALMLGRDLAWFPFED